MTPARAARSGQPPAATTHGSTPWLCGSGANIALIAPASFISLIVPLAVFFAFQRYFVQGLLAGSVK